MSERGAYGLNPRVSLTTLRFIPQGVPHDTRHTGVPLTPCALLDFCTGCDIRMHRKRQRHIRLQSVFGYVLEFHRKTVSSVSCYAQHFFACVDLDNMLQSQLRNQFCSQSKAYLTTVTCPARPRYSQKVGFFGELLREKFMRM